MGKQHITTIPMIAGKPGAVPAWKQDVEAAKRRVAEAALLPCPVPVEWQPSDERPTVSVARPSANWQRTGILRLDVRQLKAEWQAAAAARKIDLETGPTSFDVVRVKAEMEMERKRRALEVLAWAGPPAWATAEGAAVLLWWLRAMPDSTRTERYVLHEMLIDGKRMRDWQIENEDDLLVVKLLKELAEDLPRERRREEPLREKHQRQRVTLQWIAPAAGMLHGATVMPG